jgi:ABC-type Fe3+-hydroxamate transport system substrate-binding protein
MKKILLLALAILVNMVGCGKRSEQPNVPQSTNKVTNTTGNPITAPVDYLGAVGQAQKTAIKVIDTTAVAQAIELFNAQEGRFPTSLDELVQKRYLGRIPDLPKGFKYQYDPKTGKLRVIQGN